MFTDIKLNITQFPKIIQSGRFSGKTGNLCQKALLDLADPLAKVILPKLVTILNKFQRKISGGATVRAGKEFILFISNEDMEILLKLYRVTRKIRYIN